MRNFSSFDSSCLIPTTDNKEMKRSEGSEQHRNKTRKRKEQKRRKPSKSEERQANEKEENEKARKLVKAEKKVTLMFKRFKVNRFPIPISIHFEQNLLTSKR